ncbi:IS1 family transposase [Psychrobacter sp. NG27]|uniref:IS1 family transposase n=1 Tax=Psychrobacter sp. NG27 TaxID=2781966 RepID=UPI0018DFC9EF|nr:IS1 family transposase [Psychrobacter sp. NG27]MBI0427665.1 IS1 family transposase [Psychrobacter sp. NG27]
MKTQIEINCPDCHNSSLKKNGIKSYGKQNYQCKDCKRQFIGDHALTYNGCHSRIEDLIRLMTVRGCGVRDIAVIASVSMGKVLSTIGSSVYEIAPKKRYYDRLEVDEFWTYVYRKKRKVWLIYAYDRATNEIVAYVWGKRDLKTAKKLRARLKQLKVHYGSISMDNWRSFKTAFTADPKQIGKEHTVGIEGNNCRLRHRLRRAVRKTCCFSKKLDNHFKVFDLLFFYINYGYV